MTRRYEVVYIFDSALDEDQVNAHLERFHALLIGDDNPEPISNVNHWGKRTLAYPIKGREIGCYVVVQLATDPALLGEFERLVKLEESVIRHQLVLNEGETPGAVTVSDGDKRSDGDKGPDVRQVTSRAEEGP